MKSQSEKVVVDRSKISIYRYSDGRLFAYPVPQGLEITVRECEDTPSPEPCRTYPSESKES